MTDKQGQAPPALIALDWGTSSFRAFLMDASGTVLAQAAGPEGILHLPRPGAEGFAEVLAARCGPWLARWPGLPVVAGGMVGSAQGWREAPYAPCPADPATLARAAVEATTPAGVRVLIAPGLLHAPPGAPPDVMRGEEIQIAGALRAQPALAARARFILPGTHSKWVELEEGRITGFATYMTGELFAVLRHHSLLGRLMTEVAPGAEEAAAAFAQGLDLARASGPGDLPHQIFAARSLGLTGRMAPAALAEFLSGLLIGHEVVSGLARTEGTAPLVLIGEAGLCRRYATALAAFGAPAPLPLGNTAPAGLFHFAVAAGLVAAGETTP
ncbi:2-dehydro-3-deoxygalactonokinase [Roseomonas sp. GC11]|uniref:2-dehydro-3-deoxygalactonokinase n=1 Tax=Roseomonas sp. GC11 TaxID=2950546 RepID=UPI00210E2B3A|nr:2-dehydro-3-deoxygalactonokinase [Roseomonas sp. GC11]